MKPHLWDLLIQELCPQGQDHTNFQRYDQQIQNLLLHLYVIFNE